MGFLRDMFWVYVWLAKRAAIVVPLGVLVYALVVAAGNFFVWAFDDPEQAFRETVKIVTLVLTVSGIFFWFCIGMGKMIDSQDESQPW